MKSPFAAGIELSVLALWLGAAILVAAVVAPAAFAVLPSRSLAGSLIGRVLPAVFVSGIVAAIIAAACEMTVSRTRFSIMLTAPLIAVAAGCAIAQFVISPRIERIRTAAGGSIDALTATDPNRLMFGRLHAFSTLCLGVAMLGAVWTIASRLYHSSRSEPFIGHSERSEEPGARGTRPARDPSLRSG